MQRFNDGIEIFENALDLDPDNTELLELLALGYVGRRDLDQAIKYYERLSLADPGRVETYLTIATLYEARGQIKEAIAVLEDVPLEIRTADIYIKLAALAGTANDHKSAIEYYRQGYAMDTTDIVALIGMGTGFSMVGITDSAVYYYKKANEVSFNADIGQRLIDLYISIDNYEPVLDVAQQILVSEPENTHVRRSLGFAYYKMGQLNDALDQFYIALRYDANDSYSAFYIARIYFEQEDYGRALSEIENAIAIDEDFVELWIYMGFIAVEKNEYELADYAFAEAAFRNADMTQVYYLLGAIAETQAMKQRAYRYYRKAVNEDSANIPALQALAGLASSLDRDEETFQVFRRILKVDTLNAVALNYVGYTFAERNDSLDYALKLVDRALEIDADNGYYLDSRGWVFYMMGRYEEAVIELERAADKVKDAVIFEHLGDAYRKTGQSSQAIDAYERAVELDPKSKHLQKKIDELK